jgi:hypothetical protein
MSFIELLKKFNDDEICFIILKEKIKVQITNAATCGEYFASYCANSNAEMIKNDDELSPIIESISKEGVIFFNWETKHNKKFCSYIHDVTKNAVDKQLHFLKNRIEQKIREEFIKKKNVAYLKMFSSNERKYIEDIVSDPFFEKIMFSYKEIDCKWNDESHYGELTIQW